MTTRYLVQVKIHDADWSTVNKRAGFKQAKAVARRLAREMKRAHPVAIIRDGDQDAPILRRLEGNNFEL